MDQKTVNQQYCQSCGMPLRFDVEEYLGTNADGSKSNEYCYYCLKDGEYIVDIPMKEMTDIWVKYTDKYNEYAETNYTPDELKRILNKRLPTLKRWKQKEATRNIHDEAILKIKAHIDYNLFTSMSPQELCKEINLSYYHFRKIFKNITGENIGSYIQRLRLEHIANLLISTDLPASHILIHTNYQTKFSLSKAFKKHFGISISAYRKQHQNLLSKEPYPYIDQETQPEIKKLNKQKAICYPADQAFRDQRQYKNAWKEIIHYKEKYLKSEKENKMICISLDNPFVTPQEKCRFHLGILTTEENKHTDRFHVREIPGGIYAVFTHKGSYTSLPELYQYIYEKWLPQSNYCQKHPISFEIYQNTPRNANLSELLTCVYIPIKRK